jgi:hypothetical protein
VAGETFETEERWAGRTPAVCGGGEDGRILAEVDAQERREGEVPGCELAQGDTRWLAGRGEGAKAFRYVSFAVWSETQNENLAAQVVGHHAGPLPHLPSLGGSARRRDLRFAGKGSQDQRCHRTSGVQRVAVAESSTGEDGEAHGSGGARKGGEDGERLLQEGSLVRGTGEALQDAAGPQIVEPEADEGTGGDHRMALGVFPESLPTVFLLGPLGRTVAQRAVQQLQSGAQADGEPRPLKHPVEAVETDAQGAVRQLCQPQETRNRLALTVCGSSEENGATEAA